MLMVRPAQDEHPLWRRQPREELRQPRQRDHHIVLGRQQQSRHLSAPREGERQPKDSWSWVRDPARCQRHNGPHPRIDFGRRQHRPTTEAVANESDSRGVDVEAGVLEQMVDEKTDVRYPAGDHGLGPGGPLGFGFAFAAGEFRRDQLGVIHRGHDVAVTGQMRAEEGGRPPVSTAGMGEDNQRLIRARDAGRGPDHGWESPAASRIQRLDGLDANGETSGCERIVSMRADRPTLAADSDYA